MFHRFCAPKLFVNMHLYRFLQKSCCPPWSHSSKHTTVCKNNKCHKRLLKCKVTEIVMVLKWTIQVNRWEALNQLHLLLSSTVELGWGSPGWRSESSPRPAKSSNSSYWIWDLLKRLIGTLGVAVLRVPEAKRLGNWRVGRGKQNGKGEKWRLEQGSKRDNRDWVTALQAELEGRQMEIALLQLEAGHITTVIKSALFLFERNAPVISCDIH